MEMDLKYCRRTELIELIETQRRTIEELKAENAQLRSRGTPEAGTVEDVAAPKEPVVSPLFEAERSEQSTGEETGALEKIIARLDGMRSAESARMDELESENARLRAQLEKRLKLGGETGNLAEAALSLHGVFESAQRAAEQYLSDVKNARGDAESMLREAAAQAERIVRAAQTAAQAREQATDEALRVKEEEFKKRCEEMVQNYEVLKKLIGR